MVRIHVGQPTFLVVSEITSQNLPRNRDVGPLRLTKTNQFAKYSRIQNPSRSGYPIER